MPVGSNVGVLAAKTALACRDEGPPRLPSRAGDSKAGPINSRDGWLSQQRDSFQQQAL
jgi:hypothetical protein